MTVRMPTFSPFPATQQDLVSRGPAGVGLNLSSIEEGEKLTVGDRVYLARPSSVPGVDFVVVSHGVLVNFDLGGNPIVLWDGANGPEAFVWGREDGNQLHRDVIGTVIGVPVTWDSPTYGHMGGQVVSVGPYSFTIRGWDGGLFFMPHGASSKFRLRFP